ncbi:hypothetical protein [Streptomyces sp. NPDC018321]|uniref:hypothetical protein n=1 Tax=unclassified Streptomyces TaxID=2593676 RepID=UPI0037896DAC
MPLHAGEHRVARRYRAFGRYRVVGQHRAAGQCRAWPRRGRPDRRRARLYGLAAIVVCAVVLPFAVASAGPSGDRPSDAEETPATVPLVSRGGDGKAPGDAGADEGAGRGRAEAAASARSPLPAGPATAVRCGPELTSPEGVEAQTCVLTQGTGSGTRTWARTYYRNATGDPLEAVLSLLGPDGRSVRMRCEVGAEDAPGTCETPREPVRGGPAAYTAVAEFAGRAGYGPLLLRTGSNRGDGGTGSGGAVGDGGNGSVRSDEGRRGNSTTETRS